MSQWTCSSPEAYNREKLCRRVREVLLSLQRGRTSISWPLCRAISAAMERVSRVFCLSTTAPEKFYNKGKENRGTGCGSEQSRRSLLNVRRPAWMPSKVESHSRLPAAHCKRQQGKRRARFAASSTLFPNIDSVPKCRSVVQPPWRRQRRWMSFAFFSTEQSRGVARKLEEWRICISVVVS